MAAVAVGLGLQAGSSYIAGGKTKKEARKAARLERLMTSEELRRLSIEQDQVLGSAKSQIAASGFTGYGATTEAYLENLQSEQNKQQAFTAQVGASRASAIQDRGNALASGYKYDALSSLVSGAGAIGKSFNWGLDSKPKRQWEV